MTQSGWLNRNGLRLALHGAGSTGPALVFQHGLCGDARQVAEAMAGLAPQRWVCLECPSHGASDMDPTPSLASFADHVAALAETFDGPVVLGGISMGAAIATRLAVTRPDLVRALVLVRPAWVAEAAPATMAPNAEVGALLARLTAGQARGIFAASPTARHLAVVAPDNLASLMGFFDRTPQEATARLLTAISADGPGISSDDLAVLTLPVLVCATSEDAVHPAAHAEALAGIIPKARLVHLPPKGRDKPAHLAALAAAMRQFLKEI
ncbi:alpha/beta fold hydrolase [Tabrizicola sp.]|uniref:alpha/beta fold hydrolase n=1 Tax=Tabrizicola sp. TaxID=2005166 RepID=UPI00273294AB|nr:alpha/beta hydrolase [Tabrizicola sp.]MDP3196129.1 alpha/beta hydrolase [Tabrizicola sp.]